MAKEDPLAAQVWKMYARTKSTQPHAHRMENLTWRMMALALKKKKEEEERKSVFNGGEDKPAEDRKANHMAGTKQTPDLTADGERGRRIDKGKAKVSVVGFDGQNPDDVDDSEYVTPLLVC